MNGGLTLDFNDDPGDFPIRHFCLRVSDSEFDAILGRIRASGITYKGTPHGPVDRQVNTSLGGRIV